MSTTLRIFPTVPRNLPPRDHVDQLLRLARFSDDSGLTGILLFAGNDTVVEPWPWRSTSWRTPNAARR